MNFSARRGVPGILAIALCLFPAPFALAVEAVGDAMGYRIFGEPKKNRPLLLQNSRPHAVQVFDEGRGVFVSVPPYSDRKLPCRSRSLVLNVRFRDAFGDSLPFQLRVSCGQEVQFIAPVQVAPVRPTGASATEEPDLPGQTGPGATGEPHDGS